MRKSIMWVVAGLVIGLAVCFWFNYKKSRIDSAPAPSAIQSPATATVAHPLVKSVTATSSPGRVIKVVAEQPVMPVSGTNPGAHVRHTVGMNFGE